MHVYYIGVIIPMYRELNMKHIWVKQERLFEIDHILHGLD